MKNKNYLIILIEVKKTFDKIHYQFMIKILSKVELEGTYFNRIKHIYNKCTGKFILKGTKLKPFSLRSQTRQGCLFSLLLSNIVLKILATSIRQEKETKLFYIWWKEVQLPLPANYIIYWESNLVRANGEFSEVAQNKKLILKSWLHF